MAVELLPKILPKLLLKSGRTLTALRASPTTITSGTLAMWLDASQLTGLNDNDPVTTFTDLSGLGHGPTQATAGLKPLYKTNIQNGKPVVRFDGVDDTLKATFTLNAPVWALIVAIYRNGAGTNPTLVDGNLGNTGRIYYDGVGTLTLNAGANLGRVFTPLRWAVYTILINGASSSLNVDSLTPTLGNAGAGSPGGVTLGSTGGSLQWGAVDIAEVLYYSVAPSAQDQASLVSYARSKWGI